MSAKTRVPFFHLIKSTSVSAKNLEKIAGILLKGRPQLLACSIVCFKASGVELIDKGL